MSLSIRLLKRVEIVAQLEAKEKMAAKKKLFSDIQSQKYLWVGLILN